MDRRARWSKHKRSEEPAVDDLYAANGKPTERSGAKEEVVDELRMCNKTQSRQLSALKASVQSQEMKISGLREEVQSQRKQIEEMEAKMESSVREKVEVEVVDMQSNFYKQIFLLLEIIALRNDDLKMPNPNRSTTTMLGAVGGATVGALTIGGISGHEETEPAIGGALVGGSIGALVSFALGKPKSIASVLSKMDEKEKLHMARIAVKLARERNLDFAEQILAKAILDNPAKSRSFLIAILQVKKLNFEEYSYFM